MIEELRDDVVLYDVLRRVFLREPTEDLLRFLLGLPIEDGGEADGLSLMIEDLRAHRSDLRGYAEDLAVEYTRLFLGPVRPPVVPFASYYLSESQQLMTDETIDVRRRYLDAGMAVRELHSIPDDHVGIELEFLFCLTGKTVDSQSAGMDTEASKLYEKRQSFLSEHCALWFPLFAERILASTENAFFRGAASLLKECLG